MRRLWAHIVLAFTALVLIGTTFSAVFTKTGSNIEYQNGKEIAYRISDKDDPEAVLEEGAAEEVATEFEKRLETAGVSRYKVVVEGNDTVKVTFSQDTDDEYSRLSAYLAFNGSLALTTSNNHYVLGSEFLTDEKAYLDDVNGYPTVVIPVNVDNPSYKDVIAACEQQRDNNEEGGETNTDDEGNESTSYYVYMWYDYEPEYDLYEYATDQENEGYDSNIANKLFMKFSIDNLYFPDDENNKLASSINVTTGEDGTASVANIRSAYSTARFYVNLINAGELPYHCEMMYSRTAEAFVENPVELGQHVTVAWSKTFIATLCAVIVVSLLLVVFYRLGALSVATISIASTFAGIGAITILSVNFNICAIVGLVTVAIASLASGIVYLSKLKDEAYKGRSLKKANSEASKKSTLPIVDINVVTMIAGAIAYLLGGALMKSFAAVTVIGGLVSLILNTLALKGMMWLSTNATGLTGKYEVFGIDSKKVPNLMSEEKQTYFGAYADKDFTKKKKPVAIVSALLFVAALAGTIVFGITKNGAVYNDGTNYAPTEIYFESERASEDTAVTLNPDAVTDILEHTYVYDSDESKAVQLNTLVDGIPTLYSYSTSEQNVYTYHYVVVVTLTSEINQDEKLAYYVDSTDAKQMVGSKLAEVLEAEVASWDSDAKADVKNAHTVTSIQPKFVPIVLATVVGIAVSAAYLMLRYRLSRGLAALVMPIATTTIAAGIFALIRVPVGSTVVLALPIIAVFSLIISIIFMNKEREMVIEDKTRDNSVENRQKIMVKANSSAFAPILMLSVLVLYIGIDFFGFGPIATTWIFILILLGCLISSVLVTTLFGPLSQVFFKWFKFINVSKPRKEKKKTKKVTTSRRSAEPEEAVFIGIND